MTEALETAEKQEVHEQNQEQEEVPGAMEDSREGILNPFAEESEMEHDCDENYSSHDAET
jgi:hypothetical protein